MIEAKRALVSQVVGRDVVQHAAAALAPLGIPVLPLKGVWLQACVYGPHEPRLITDVDLLVPEPAFPRACERLASQGWRLRPGGNPAETALDHPEFALPLDLHRRLFTRSAFKLATHDLFARSCPDSATFGVEVRLQDPRDALAHLVGHFLKARTPRDDRLRLRDFVAIARRCAVPPQAHARHLDQTGMARAARFVLGGLASDPNEPFFRDLIGALARDPLGESLVRFAGLIADHVSDRSPIGALPGFMLDHSMPAGAVALVLRAVERAHRARPGAKH